MTREINEGTALVIVDIQNDYFEGGRFPLYRPKKAMNATKQILDIFRSKNRPIYHIQHISTKEGARFFLPNTVGVEIHDMLTPHKGEQIIVKHSANSFYETTLHENLKSNKITQVVICGMMSHHCIDSTVRACVELGYETTLVRDACTTTNLKGSNATIDAETVHEVFMAALQGFANIIDSKNYIEDND